MGDDDRWQRPPGTTDETVAALGKLSEALEYVHRVRGACYELHQLVGRADLLFEDAVGLLREAGHEELATLVATEVVGRNVLPGRWTFQVVEEFDDTYYRPVVAAEERARTELVGGRRHVHESEMKEARRTQGRPGHERRPDEP